MVPCSSMGTTTSRTCLMRPPRLASKVAPGSASTLVIPTSPGLQGTRALPRRRWPSVAAPWSRSCQHGTVDMTLLDRVISRGRVSGLDAVGVASAEPFMTTRRDLESRKGAGLHGGMQFTYRNSARSTDASATLAGARSIVVGALGYGGPEPIRPPGPQGRIARYARADLYGDLRKALGEVARLLQDEGWSTRTVADDNALVDREAAYRAALGWYGKNSNLLLPGRGSWFVLGSVITDAPLRLAERRVPDGCHTCRRCMEGCPTGAIVEPGVVDSRRCLAWLVQRTGSFPREYRRALGDRIYGCDECQEVCPLNRPDIRDSGTVAVSGHDGDVGAWVSPLEMLKADDETLMQRHGRWYIPGRDPRYLRRNALIVLGNTACGNDGEVEAVLIEYLSSEDDLLVEHAAGAASELGRLDLVEEMATGPVAKDHVEP
ncbi:MAG: tRNA epoxyqueuosine(34) reductase QueG [Actinobacteria bacterium]|nr:MAG: tRNA epoxyqueuosine(34) reductase QueG [Actinomycetota bacterium]